MRPANFFPMEKTLPSPTGTVHQPNSAEEGRAEEALPNSSYSLGTAQLGSRLLELAPFAGLTHYGGLAAWAEEAREGDGRKRGGEEPQEYEAKLQTISC